MRKFRSIYWILISLMTSCGQNKDGLTGTENSKDKDLETSKDNEGNAGLENHLDIKFDTIKTYVSERKFEFSEEISLHQFIGIKGDSLFHGILTMKDGIHQDSVYFLHLVKSHSKDRLPCFYGKARFLEIKGKTIYSFQIFDQKKSCKGGLGKQIVVDDYYFKIDKSGNIVRFDTILYKHPCPHVNMDC